MTDGRSGYLDIFMPLLIIGVVFLAGMFVGALLMLWIMKG